MFLQHLFKKLTHFAFLFFGILLFLIIHNSTKVGAVNNNLPEDSNYIVVSADAAVAGSFSSPDSYAFLYVPIGATEARLDISNVGNGRLSAATINRKNGGSCGASLATQANGLTGFSDDRSVVYADNEFINTPGYPTTDTFTAYVGGVETEYNVYCTVVSTNSALGCNNVWGDWDGDGDSEWACIPYYSNVIFRSSTNVNSYLGTYPGDSANKGTGYFASNGSTWSITLEFATPCGPDVTGSTNPIELYDLDNGYSQPAGQNVEVWMIRYQRPQDGGAYISSPGLSGDVSYDRTGLGANVYDTDGGNYAPYNNNYTWDVYPGTYFADSKYSLTVAGIGRNNKIRIRVPFDQMNAAIDCPPPSENEPPTGNINVVCNAAGTQITVNVVSASDPDGDSPLSISLTVQHNGGPSTVSGSGSGSTITPGTSTFTPNYLGANSTRQVSGTISDGEDTTTMTTVNYSCNRPPSGTIRATCNTDGTIVTVDVINATDPDSSTQSMSISLTVQHDGGPTTTTGSGSGSNITITPSPSTFTPNYLGAASTRRITGSISDGTGSRNMSSVDYDCNRPPTITVGTVNCRTYSFTVNDPDGDDVSIALLVNGAIVLNNSGNPHATFNLSNQTANNTSYSFNLSSWQDFSSRNFRVRVNDNEGSGNRESANTSVGPCMYIECTSATPSSSPVEINTNFDVTVQLAAKYTTDDVAGPIGSRGSDWDYDLDVNVNPPNVTNSISDTLNPDEPATGSFSHTVGTFTAPSSEGPGTITFSVTGENGVSTNDDCGDTSSITFAAIPYFQSFRGDIVAGYGMKDSSGLCTIPPGINGDIITRIGYQVAGADSDGDGNPDIVGAGTQTAVFARGAVNNFRSSISQTNRNSSPWINIFANEGVASVDASASSNNLGGNFDTSLCAEDWFYDEPDAYINDPDGDGKIDVSSIRGLVGYNGPIEMSYSSPLDGNRKIFVNGDVIIGSTDVADTGTHSYVYNTTGWESIYDIPVAVIVATGNIYIDDNVSVLDAILVAQGTVFTCAPTQNGLPTDAQEVTDGTNTTAPFIAGGGCYDRPLSLHGAIISNSVRLWRTGGTLSEQFNGAVAPSTGYQTYGDGLTQAETFRLPAEVYLAPRFGEASLNGSQGKKQLDSLISLPPQF